MLLYISFHKKWKSAIRAEVLALLAKHTSSSEPLHKRLSAIPIAAWEDEMPTVELALRETIRLVVNFTSLRRNVPGGDKGGGGFRDEEVPSNGFMAYNLTDVHMNPNIYTHPEVFDPERFNPGREEDKGEPYGYLGWGVGK
jgi:cytochrome P450